MALKVTSEAIQVHGDYGFYDEFAVSRFTAAPAAGPSAAARMRPCAT